MDLLLDSFVPAQITSIAAVICTLLEHVQFPILSCLLHQLVTMQILVIVTEHTLTTSDQYTAHFGHLKLADLQAQSASRHDYILKK